MTNHCPRLATARCASSRRLRRPFVASPKVGASLLTPTEQRSYPAGREGATRIRLTIDRQARLTRLRSPPPPSVPAPSATSPRVTAMTLRERKTYRQAILRALYGAVERNRPEVSGATLRDEVSLPDADLSAACAYLADAGLITVDWTSHKTPATASLTHEGIRFMEEEEESAASTQGD